ncbi:hypothetical protein ACIQAC_18495 [Streptomyces sp. NPDC088387]|uniref:hypothetical protein n=1 Tax=Streptomyces sp. NPDC088387 TaxID=3365859 RepID=UPI0037F2DEA1
MATAQLIVIYPPAEDGGRRVRAGDQFLGMAYGLVDVAEFLRRIGLEGLEDTDVARMAGIEWRGGGPDSWDR